MCGSSCCQIGEGCHLRSGFSDHIGQSILGEINPKFLVDKSVFSAAMSVVGPQD